MPREREYLAEMQIDCWELVHPERMTGYATAKPSFRLPDSCELLLVSPVLPEYDEAEYLVKILASMQLSIDQVRHIYPQQLDMVDVDVTGKMPKWIWLAGCDLPADEPYLSERSQRLSSPLLTDIRGNSQHRRALWQQICSYA
jgi:DNA polymerase-3 subunit psi